MLRRPGRTGLVARAGAVLAAVGLAVAPVAVPAHADEIRDRQQPILRALGVPEAWKITRGAGVTVAVVDSGVDPGQADLRGSVTAGPNMLADIDGRRPPVGRHGTGMASLIAGHGHGPGGRDGVIGVAPQARILSLRVIAEPGDPSYALYRSGRESDSVARGIRYAADNGADVINLSIGNDRPDPEEREAVAHAIAKGAVVISAVGNDGDERDRLDENGFAPYSYPASYPGVIGVAATGRGNDRAPFSNRNHSVVVSAPGVGIPVAGPGDDYFLTEGTSDASALVSGIAALIRSRHPDLRPALVRQALLDSTRHRPAGEYDASVGFGQVHAGAALRAAARLAAARDPGGLPADERFGADAPGPVKVIDRPVWLEPVAIAAIVLCLGGVAGGGALAVTLWRRTRPLPWWAGPVAVAGPPPRPVPPPLVFDDAAPPPERPAGPPVFERPEAPAATETPAPERPAAPVVPAAPPGVRMPAPTFEHPTQPSGPSGLMPPPPEPSLLNRPDPPPRSARPQFEPPA
ncbi:S8 family serine peptidase [Thermomonospora cellulosilytica]|uniref:Type VII secretion-associated serine protease mycosin n=1 Tax=Thermomonospora cellulosilytica TaxID=1411118 RepID=A0A7W3N4S1_9ACTN|nr:S8 family serine peptidase [Thermomonospora cellulosilytica]MBA9007541.1 type VII secretion-associated serine protease mycosin [Thermomonospora cellulosilytica]